MELECKLCSERLCLWRKLLFHPTLSHLVTKRELHQMAAGFLLSLTDHHRSNSPHPRVPIGSRAAGRRLLAALLSGYTGSNWAVRSEERIKARWNISDVEAFDPFTVPSERAPPPHSAAVPPSAVGRILAAKGDGATVGWRCHVILVKMPPSWSLHLSIWSESNNRTRGRVPRSTYMVPTARPSVSTSSGDKRPSS